MDAISWSGSGVTISVFALIDCGATPDFTMKSSYSPRVRSYVLERDGAEVELPEVIEYDLNFSSPPVGIGLYLESCLVSACDAGAAVAWLAFEGSFSYDHLLTHEVADQVYGVCARGERAHIVLDDDKLVGQEWRDTVGRYRIYVEELFSSHG